MQISGTIRSIPGKTAGVPRVGDLLRVTVRRADRSEHLVLQGKNLHITVKENSSLYVGDRLTARVLAIHPRLLLEVVSRESGTRSGRARLSPAAADRNDSLISILTHALENSGHTSDEGRLRYIVALYRRYFGLPREGERKKVQLSRARSVVELADRALDRANECRHDQVTDLVQWFSGIGNKRNDKRKETEHDDRAGGASGPNDLGSYLRRSTESPNHLLQLYNTLKPTGDLHWVVVPIRGWRNESQSKTAHDAVDAVLKIGWVWKERKPVEALLSVKKDSGVRWWFRWTIRNMGHNRIVELRNVWSEDDNAQSVVGGELLARLGFSGHTGDVKQKVESDGFTANTSREGEELRIDTYG